MQAIITQRQILDQYGTAADSLEGKYVNYFESLKLSLISISNFSKNYKKVINNCKFNLLILTGGGSIPWQYYDKKSNYAAQKERDKLEKELIEIALNKKIPILAICRGMQYINGILGGKVSKLDHLNIKRSIGEDHPIVLNGKKIKINNFHNDGIYLHNLAKGCLPIAMDVDNNIVEAFYCPKYKILGIQWHPERKFVEKKSEKVTRSLILKFIRNGGIL